MNDPLAQLRLRFAGLQLQAETPYGLVYAGQDFTGAAVTVALLNPRAAADPGVRQAFANVIWQYSNVPAHGPLAVYAADLNTACPWAAVRGAAGQPGAEQLLQAVGAGGLAVSPAAPGPPGAPPPPPLPAGLGAPSLPTHVAAPGYGAPPGAYPGAGQPPFGAPPPPAQPGSGSPWPWLIGIAAAVVVLVLMAVVAVVAVQSLGGDDEEPIAGQQPDLPQLPTGPPGPGTGPEPPGGDIEPELRDLPPISLIGPTWGQSEDTYTMTFPGWPFAFRTPPAWNCFAGSFDEIPEAVGWHCGGEAGSDQRVSVILWECPTTCTDAEQEDMVGRWLDDPDEAVRADEVPAAYVEYDSNVRGLYAVDLSHFAGDPADPDGPLRWHVGVYAESPEETRDAVLKVVNDIITQSTG